MIRYLKRGRDAAARAADDVQVKTTVEAIIRDIEAARRARARPATHRTDRRRHHPHRARTGHPSDASLPALPSKRVLIERRADSSLGPTIAMPQLDDLPEDADLDLAVLRGDDLLLVARERNRVRALRITSGRVTVLPDIPAAGPVAGINALSGLSPPTVSLRYTDGAVDLFKLPADIWAMPIRASIDPRFSEAMPIPVAIGQEVRLFALVDGVLAYSIVDTHGQPVRQTTSIQQAPSLRTTMGTDIAVFVMMSLMMLAILYVATRPVPVREDRNGKSVEVAVPAPLHRRLAAGILDIAPLWLVTLWAIRNGADPSNLTQNLTIVGAAVGYVLYTMVAELLTGRTIGKMLFGLRVVTIAGAKPTMGAIIVRNLLRFF